jgi:hypothetical protein
MEELALLYLRKALVEAIKAGGSQFIDSLFSGLTVQQIDALIRLLDLVRARKTQQTQSKTG